VEQDAKLVLTAGENHESCVVASFLTTGGPEDDRIELDLQAAQRLAGLPGRISAIYLNVPGTPQQIENYVSMLEKRFPDLEVRPLRQFTEAQAKIYSRISGLLTAATALILALTALCVMAAMTNIAAERRHDVGMMKAIGGSARRVLNLFLTEAVILGLAGGLIGAAAGIALSIALGQAVFGVAAAPRLIVYPISVALTVIVAILGAYPLRRLGNVRPATIFRGEA
jgi:putative ABC transport system permease protein